MSIYMYIYTHIKIYNTKDIYACISFVYMYVYILN